MKITLANLKDATAQQVFNQVATHLLTQNAKSQKSPDRMCMYRSPQGLSCAAGCLIGDEEYNYDLEGAQWPNLVLDGTVSDNHKSLIHDLQKLHDGTPPDDWSRHLAMVADYYKLDINEVPLLKDAL